MLVPVLVAAQLMGCTPPAPIDDPAPDTVVATDGADAGEVVDRRPVTGGVARVAVASEPTTLNPWSAPRGDGARTIADATLVTLWRTRGDGSVEPWLLAGEPITSGGVDGAPLTVVYDVRSDARWSDGSPIDGDDLLATIAHCRRLPAALRPGEPCEAVDLEASFAEGRRATVVFARAVGTWRALLARMPVLPAHVLGDGDRRSSWRRSMPVTSGPFRFESWTPGERLVLVRNEQWWGDVALSRLEIVFNAPPTVAAAADGRIDVALVDPTIGNLERARADRGLRAVVTSDAAVDVLDFNLASPRVARAATRRAVAAEIDRATLVEEVVAPVAPRTATTDGLLGADDPDGPASTDAPSTGPSPSPQACGTVDGMFVCDGEPLTLRLRTGGSWRLRLAGEYIATQLEAAGISIVQAGDANAWDLRVATVDVSADPVAGGTRWRCDGDANTQAYCNSTFDGLLDQAQRTSDDSERAEVVTEADLVLAHDRPTLPLYAPPRMLVHTTRMRGPRVHAHAPGPLWNVEDWARMTTGDD
ncbi:MAG TPA: ABC transporter substrate-binding protein [Euzebyales bacterium]